MGRTKKSKPGHAVRKAERDATAAAAAAAPPPPAAVLSAEELLVQSAQHIGSLNYEQAKQLCVEAVQKAHQEMQEQKEDADPRMLRDALEILGTIELELDEAQEAREVRLLPP
jgi:polyhydroxyalkanoate synthesis regulator phasin